MYRITAWSALFLMGGALVSSADGADSAVGASFVSATAKATLTLEATSWKASPAAATIWLQVGSQHGSAVIPLFDGTTPQLHAADGPASSSAVHGSTHDKTVEITSCDTSFGLTTAAGAAAPTSTPSGAVGTGTHSYSSSSSTLAKQSGVDNSTFNMTAAPFNTTMFNATTVNTTTFNASATNATISNTTLSNATSNLPFRGPFPTQLPIFSSRAASTQSRAGQLLVAVLLHVAFALL